MKRRITIALAVTALAATVTSLAAAGLYQRARAQATTAAESLPAYEILNTVRSLGFRPTTPALRRGPYYVLHAIDPRGVEMRVVADAQLGDIVSVTPKVAPRHDGGPRIIHVPQAGERSNRGGSYEDDEAAAPEDTNEDDVAPPPRRPASRTPYQRMVAPPARASADPLPPPRTKSEPKPPRAVLSSPPPPAETSLTPIYPTPKYDARSAPGEKFAAPDDNLATMPPPPGYTPPGVPR